MTGNGYGISFQGDENILELNNDDRHTTLYIKPVNYLLLNGEY